MEAQLLHVLEQTQSPHSGPRQQAEQQLLVNNAGLLFEEEAWRMTNLFRTPITIPTTLLHSALSPRISLYRPHHVRPHYLLSKHSSLSAGHQVSMSSKGKSSSAMRTKNASGPQPSNLPRVPTQNARSRTPPPMSSPRLRVPTSLKIGAGFFLLFYTLFPHRADPVSTVR